MSENTLLGLNVLIESLKREMEDSEIEDVQNNRFCVIKHYVIKCPSIYLPYPFFF